VINGKLKRAFNLPFEVNCWFMVILAQIFRIIHCFKRTIIIHLEIFFANVSEEESLSDA